MVFRGRQRVVKAPYIDPEVSGSSSSSNAASTLIIQPNQKEGYSETKAKTSSSSSSLSSSSSPSASSDSSSSDNDDSENGIPSTNSSRRAAAAPEEKKQLQYKRHQTRKTNVSATFTTSRGHSLSQRGTSDSNKKLTELSLQKGRDNSTTGITKILKKKTSHNELSEENEEAEEPNHNSSSGSTNLGNSSSDTNTGETSAAVTAADAPTPKRLKLDHHHHHHHHHSLTDDNVNDADDDDDDENDDDDDVKPDSEGVKRNEDSVQKIKKNRSSVKMASSSSSRKETNEKHPRVGDHRGGSEAETKKKNQADTHETRHQRRATTTPKSKPIVDDYTAEALTELQLDQIRNYINTYSSLTIPVIKTILKKNNQTANRTKKELVIRLAEGKVLGAVPKCSECNKGQLDWNRDSGVYKCSGYFDLSKGGVVRCSFTSESVERKPWEE